MDCLWYKIPWILLEQLTIFDQIIKQTFFISNSISTLNMVMQQDL